MQVRASFLFSGCPEPCQWECSFWSISRASHIKGIFGLTAGQPRRSMSTGAARRPAKEPTWSPEKIKAIALDRSLCLQTLATMSVAEVGATPSPRPTNTLQRKIPASSEQYLLTYRTFQWKQALRSCTPAYVFLANSMQDLQFHNSPKDASWVTLCWVAKASLWGQTKHSSGRSIAKHCHI